MFLHEKVGVAHLDLKLENVLLGNQNELKICDVAMARDVSKPIGKKFGTEGYMAPEVAERVESDTFEAIPVDIFALGVILFIFKFGAPPFKSASMADINFRTLQVKT